MGRTEQLRAQLRTRRGQYQRIVEQTSLKYFWLSKFATNAIADPRASKLDELERWLSENPLPSDQVAA